MEQTNALIESGDTVFNIIYLQAIEALNQVLRLDSLNLKEDLFFLDSKNNHPSCCALVPARGCCFA